jgi:hypothetical protein
VHLINSSGSLKHSSSSSSRQQLLLLVLGQVQEAWL